LEIWFPVAKNLIWAFGMAASLFIKTLDQCYELHDISSDNPNDNAPDE
jgi:hypothetical protein